MGKTEQTKHTKVLIIALSCFVVTLVAFAVLFHLYGPKKIVEDPSSVPSSATDGTSSSNAPVFAKTITVDITFADGSERSVTIGTNAASLRTALEEQSLIAGEESEFGLFVKTVDGVTADDAKREWWAFYKDGTLLNTGVDSTPIADGDRFAIKLETY